MVIEAVAHSGHHMTAEEVFEVVQSRTRSLNLATVYRTLELLVEEGMVSQVDLGYGRTVYATIQHGPHIHLVCRQCGKILEVDNCTVDPLCQEIKEKHGFSCDLQHLSISGLCAECQNENEESF
jgi:Fur family ferric uptake transcriptional regulator